MALFDRFNRKSRITELVRAGLANGESTTVKQIRDCIYLLRNALGDTWQMASKEAAAGMALVALARDVTLQRYLNCDGWKLVLSFVSANPEMAGSLSPRIASEIHCYREAGSTRPG